MGNLTWGMVPDPSRGGVGWGNTLIGALTNQTDSCLHPNWKNCQHHETHTLLSLHPSVAIVSSQPLPPWRSASVTGEAPHSIRHISMLLHPSNYSIRCIKLSLSSGSTKSKSAFLLMAELNPGPNWKYPCGACSGPVKSNQKGIYCDVCTTWFLYIGLSDQEFSISPDTLPRHLITHCLASAMRPMQISTPSQNSLN